MWFWICPNSSLLSLHSAHIYRRKNIRESFIFAGAQQTAVHWGDDHFRKISFLSTTAHSCKSSHHHFVFGELYPKNGGISLSIMYKMRVWNEKIGRRNHSQSWSEVWCTISILNFNYCTIALLRGFGQYTKRNGRTRKSFHKTLTILSFPFFMWCVRVWCVCMLDFVESVWMMTVTGYERSTRLWDVDDDWLDLHSY